MGFLLTILPLGCERNDERGKGSSQEPMTSIYSLCHRLTLSLLVMYKDEALGDNFRNNRFN